MPRERKIKNILPRDWFGGVKAGHETIVVHGPCSKCNGRGIQLAFGADSPTDNSGSRVHAIRETICRPCLGTGIIMIKYEVQELIDFLSDIYGWEQREDAKIASDSAAEMLYNIEQLLRERTHLFPRPNELTESAQ